MVAALRSSEAPRALSDDIGPYELLEKLGQGGMAEIYRARLRDDPSAPEVVVKSMLRDLAKVPSLVEMFESEARLTSQLAHPNIVRVDHYAVHDGVPYLTMEYLDGRNLSQLRVTLRTLKRTIPIHIAIRIAYDLGTALGCAHNFIDRVGRRMQIIHRDVSPSNVMVQNDGSVKLLDFGVARLSTAAGHIITTSLKGKFAYMAPEQVTQQPIDRRCDVFAAGIVLHEMLTNRRLFGTKSEMETLRRVSNAEAVAPSVLNREVPPVLDEVVMRALSLRPADRFDSGEEFADALVALGPLASRGDVADFMAETHDGEDPWMVLRQRAVAREAGRDTDAHALALDAESDFDETSPGNDATYTQRGHLRLLERPPSSIAPTADTISSVELQIIRDDVTEGLEITGAVGPDSAKLVLMPSDSNSAPLWTDDTSSAIGTPRPHVIASPILASTLEIDESSYAPNPRHASSRRRWVVPILGFVAVAMLVFIGLAQTARNIEAQPIPVIEPLSPSSPPARPRALRSAPPPSPAVGDKSSTR